MASITSGATRNVYIGSVDDFEKFNEEKFRQDFGEFGGKSRLREMSKAVKLIIMALLQRLSKSISFPSKRPPLSTCKSTSSELLSARPGFTDPARPSIQLCSRQRYQSDRADQSECRVQRLQDILWQGSMCESTQASVGRSAFTIHFSSP